mgnify:CR=1 FL=1|tara:strand:- start:1292 stop:2161 length:870 start_codon:yes stop_codon:yes gene_type:complete
MKIVIIGASGFIGTHLSEHLRKSGDEVVCLDIIDGSIDVTDLSIVERVLMQLSPDIVYILAAKMRVSEFHPSPTSGCDVNIQGLSNVMYVCSKIPNLHKIVFSSTIHVYSCTSDSHVDENTVLDYNNIVHPYAWTKLSGEALVRSYGESLGVPYMIMRFGIVYGPQGHTDMVLHRYIDNSITHTPVDCYGTGEVKRIFVHVHDLVRGLREAGVCSHVNETINLCNTNTISIREIIELVSSVYNQLQVNYTSERALDFSSPEISNDKAFKYLQWTPDVSMDYGIKSYRET